MKDELKTKEVEALKEKQEWWWVAEKTRSARLDYLRKAVWDKGVKGVGYLPGIKVDLERSLLYTQGYRENENDPEIIRRAKALANLFDNISIFIVDNSQIVGYLGGAPHAVMWHCERDFMSNESVYNDRTLIPEPEEESLRTIREISDYWGPRSEAVRMLSMLPPEDVMKFATGFIIWGSPLPGYSTIQYEYLFKNGYNGLIKEIDQKIAEAQDKLYQGVPEPEDYVNYERLEVWNGMKIALEAAIRYARRYSRLARIIAENFETDPERKKELLRVSETCYKVPANPPEHLWESIQFDWFNWFMGRFEKANTWPHRPDYFHFPYYERDVIKENNITRDDAIDLVGELMIRTFESSIYSPPVARAAIQGISGIYVMTLGGVDEDGKDSCNDMTDVILEAARLVRVAAPTYGFRYHPNVRVQTLRQVFECIRQGLGYPSMRNDPILIANAMHWHKHPLKEARTWVHQACMSPCPTTKWGCQPTRMASATIICAKAMEYTFHNGYDPVLKMQVSPRTGDPTKFKDFEELYQAWHTQIKWLMDTATRFIGAGRANASRIYPL
ncbi:MAG: pyruvate formate lyase family protein, partial [Thermodesulfobacteriota bacterium]|nr:pyruvate formate lyase family protein [Thermodesulfobacteriota bacterium]